MTTRVIGGLVPGFLFVACFAAHAAEPVAVQPQEQSQDVVFNGMKVAIDPKTGRIRPMTAEESAKLSAAMTQSASKRMQGASLTHSRQPLTAADARATAQKHVGGAVSVRVPASMWSEMRVARDATGKLKYSEGQPGNETTAHAVSPQEATE